MTVPEVHSRSRAVDGKDAVPPRVAEADQTLPRVVRRFMQNLPAGGIVVAVSGGPDSVALLRALLEVRGDAGRCLLAAHFNHRLRATEADADETFVRDLCRGLAASGVADVQWISGSLDVAAVARRAKENIEAAARRERYAWLAATARARGLPYVATGHTADDQAETVLHRLLRGTGVAGLRGIAPRRPLGAAVELVRPLLGATRAEVLEYLESRGQPYRHDTSNLDPARTRNRIRHDLLPALARDYNPRIVEVLCRLAGQAAEAFQEDLAAAESLLPAAERPRADARVVLDRDTLRAAPRSVVREALRLLWRREGWPLGRMGFEQWQRLAGLVFNQEGAADLPGGLHARRSGRVVLVGKQS